MHGEQQSEIEREEQYQEQREKHDGRELERITAREKLE
jgi:hypothetical protein